MTASHRPFVDVAQLSAIGERVARASMRQWGDEGQVLLIGRSPAFEAALDKVARVAPFDEPVLVTGESGVGKELLAQALYLLSPRSGRPYVVVNCPQYREGNMTVSELFGHRRGSFTGATSDRKGCFETADGGVVFLDEIGDLHMSAQVMLLRALADGSFQPLGSDRKTRVNVRVVAATNRSLDQLRAAEEFRDDLFFRLRYFQLELPPLRERGDDWRLLFQHFLDRLAWRHGVLRRLSSRAEQRLADYSWPGNIRELVAIATTGYAMSASERIDVEDLEPMLERSEDTAAAEGQNAPADDAPFLDMVLRGQDFWTAVHAPFLGRELNRRQVRHVVRCGLEETRGSYRDLLDLFHLDADDYQRFMDFLRHHRLKPC
ncbi:MAG: sigma 54-interacting transcriptional regulator [Acidobacteriota bacterium]